MAKTHCPGTWLTPSKSFFVPKDLHDNDFPKQEMLDELLTEDAFVVFKPNVVKCVVGESGAGNCKEGTVVETFRSECEES